jgi:ribonucleoside-diphosphate reductase alpha chain
MKVDQRSQGGQGGQDDAKVRIPVERHFTRAGEDVYDSVRWETRTAKIQGDAGDTVFEQTGVDMPASWSTLATNIVASKYFRGHLNSPQRENSVRQLIGRVVATLREWGQRGSYFSDAEQESAFADELTHILLTQKACFNSPVWFNLGVRSPDGKLVPQQASACFINSVDDTMDSIMRLAHTEAMLFKGGSGTGSNLSTIRSSREKLAGGGMASGPVSFMKGFDSFAGVIRSGGKTRRAAKMVILNADHPDVLDFVRCKSDEERKAWSLIDSGYDGRFNVQGGAYDSIQYQNANHSVRVSDAFMRAAELNGAWQTRAVTTGKVVDTIPARDIMSEIAQAAHVCGDPGLQYDTTINRWNPVKNSGRINATNPCSEFIFLDDTACNLASINLLQFADEQGRFYVDDFVHTVDVLSLAMEIIVDFASYPTEKIAENSHALRPLGLGYANLGALIMRNGFAYDSDEGRDLAAAITSLMCGRAYRRSAEIAGRVGPFSEYGKNRACFLEVIGLHKEYADKVPATHLPEDLYHAARASWGEALELGRSHGFRNAQMTVIAPTGTIAFMMDCDTTGIEPDIALVKYKQLVGGGMLKIVNRTVAGALQNRGYAEREISDIVEYIDQHDTIEGAPHLRDADLPIFDCAFRPANGSRYIHYMGHIRMMAAVQPFLSGGISKTVNMPKEATADEIAQVYFEGWRSGLKCVAIYRDGSKRSQPLSTKKDGEGDGKTVAVAVPAEERLPLRRKLPDVRHSVTHKFSITGHDGYLTVGLYENGEPGEVFLKMAKEGSTISGLMDTIGLMTSFALQYGVPLKFLVDKFSHTRFEPSGFTQNPDIPFAKSIVDYVFRWLGTAFLTGQKAAEDTQETEAEAIGLRAPAVSERIVRIRGGSQAEPVELGYVGQEDAPPCANCGAIMVRAGACYLCRTCGESGGCG